MKKLIVLILFMSCGIIFPQNNVLLTLGGADYAGDLYAYGGEELYESSGMALKVTPPAPYTFTQTGTQIQTILNGTLGAVSTTTLGVGVTSPSAIFEVSGLGAAGVNYVNMRSYRSFNGIGGGTAMGFALNNSTSAEVNYAIIGGEIQSNTAGAEYGLFNISVPFAGAISEVAQFGQNTVFNDDSKAFTFRFETDSYDSALVITNTGIYMEILGSGTGTPLSRVAGTDQIVLETSSQRYKDNIEDWNIDIAALDKLNARQFDWNDKSAVSGTHDYGLIAEEVATALPEVTLYNDKGEVNSWSVPKMTAYLLEVVKKQQKDIEDLQKRVKALEDK